MAEYQLDFDKLDGTPIINGAPIEMGGTSGGSPVFYTDTFKMTMTHFHLDDADKGGLTFNVEPLLGDNAPEGPVFLNMDAEALANLDAFAKSYNAELQFRGSNAMGVNLRIDAQDINSSDLTVTDGYNFKIGEDSSVEIVGGDELGLSLYHSGLNLSIGSWLQDGWEASQTSGGGDALSSDGLQSVIQNKFKDLFETEDPYISNMAQQPTMGLN